MTECHSCLFSYEDVDAADVPGRLRTTSAEAAGVLSRADPAASVIRPAPDVWSAAEYGCHLRDVLLAQRDRVVLAVVEDEPSLPRMHRDERVAICGYDAEPPAAVAAGLAMAGGLCALTFERLGAADWGRRLVYNWPETATRDLTWLGRHTLHEAVHHLRDMQEILGK